MPEMPEREQELRCVIADLRDQLQEKDNCLEDALAQIAELEAEAMRYRFLRDNGYLNKWWSVSGPYDRCENIDADIEQETKGLVAFLEDKACGFPNGMRIDADDTLLLRKAAERLEAQAVQIEALRTGDTCGRSCEGQAYRIEARQERARADELQKQVEFLKDERRDISTYERGYRQGREELQDSMRELLGIKSAPQLLD